VGRRLVEVVADYGGGVGGGFAVGAGGGAEAPVILKDQALRLDFTVGGDSLARSTHYADVAVDGAMLLGDDVAGGGLGAGKRGGPVGDGDVGVGPFVGAGVAGQDAEVAGDVRARAAGGDDPVSDGLIALVATGAIPAVPFGGFVAGFAEGGRGDLGDGK